MLTLSSRKREILKFIVSEHVQTASPVASSTVARSTSLKASPATIRNEMVALEEDGFILRPMFRQVVCRPTVAIDSS